MAQCKKGSEGQALIPLSLFLCFGYFDFRFLEMPRGELQRVNMPTTSPRGSTTGR